LQRRSKSPAERMTRRSPQSALTAWTRMLSLTRTRTSCRWTMRSRVRGLLGLACLAVLPLICVALRWSEGKNIDLDESAEKDYQTARSTYAPCFHAWFRVLSVPRSAARCSRERRCRCSPPLSAMKSPPPISEYVFACRRCAVLTDFFPSVQISKCIVHSSGGRLCGHCFALTGTHLRSAAVSSALGGARCENGRWLAATNQVDDRYNSRQHVFAPHFILRHVICRQHSVWQPTHRAAGAEVNSSFIVCLGRDLPG
jgi:hypothetical protein